MTPEHPQETPSPETQVERASLHVPFPTSFFYSNVSAMSTSMMDVRIGFAEANQEKHVEAKVGVVMSAEHAAQLALNLITQLAFFEDSFGPIRHPVWKVFSEQFRAWQIPMSPTEPLTTKPEVPVPGK